MKILNLYAGIGGNRKLWGDVEVVAVENNEKIAQIYQDFFPGDKVILGDAHKYLEERKGFDLSKYSGIDKRAILRNCVEPETGLHIFSEACKAIGVSSNQQSSQTNMTLFEATNTLEVKI
jgi:site-specific DNA-cytosine methylase